LVPLLNRVGSYQIGQADVYFCGQLVSWPDQLKSAQTPSETSQQRSLTRLEDFAWFRERGLQLLACMRTPSNAVKKHPLMHLMKFILRKAHSPHLLAMICFNAECFNLLSQPACWCRLLHFKVHTMHNSIALHKIDKGINIQM